MSKDMLKVAGWIDTFADDVGAVKALVGEASAPADARQLGAAALCYLVTRMDLIPDWEETCGIIDDAMILRICVSLAAEKGFGTLAGGTTATLGRLANDVELCATFLGPDLYPRLKKFAQDQVGKEVRGRTPAKIVEDPKARRDLWAEIDDELAGLPPAPMSDPAAVERTIKNYLKEKL